MNPKAGEQESDDSTRSLEIAYVLFMDIVSYSLLPIDHQSEVIQQLQGVVRQVSAFKRAQGANQVICLPTGDGMALAFFDDPFAPLRCARRISLVLKQGFVFQLRMGIHFGPIYRHADINSSANLAGGGINIAQRIMDCGDGGHILVSKAVAEVLLQLSKWKGMVHHLGEHEVKHGLRIELFNIFDEWFGNQEIPSKLKVGGAKSVKERALDVALGKEIPVHIPTELVALIRQAQSEGLKGILESDPDYSVTADDVRSKPLILEFPTDPKGRPAPLDVTLRIASPDFEPKSQSKIIRVPPLADSETCIFLLTPTQLGELLVNVELYAGDVTLLSRVLKTHARTSDRMPAELTKAIVTIPLIVVVRPSDLAIPAAEGQGDRPHFQLENQSLDLLLAGSELQPAAGVAASTKEITEEIPADLLHEPGSGVSDMKDTIHYSHTRCLYCGEQMAQPKRLTAGGEFCSDAHKQSYQEEYNRLALSRLLRAQSKTDEIKMSRPSAELELSRPSGRRVRSRYLKWRNLTVIAVLFIGCAIVIPFASHKRSAPPHQPQSTELIFERPDQVVSIGEWWRTKTPSEYLFVKPGALRFNLAFRGPGGNPSGHQIEMEWVIAYLSSQERIVYRFEGTTLKREAFSVDGSASTTVACRFNGQAEFNVSIQASRVVVESPGCDHPDSYETSTRDLTLGKVGIRSNAYFRIR